MHGDFFRTTNALPNEATAKLQRERVRTLNGVTRLFAPWIGRGCQGDVLQGEARHHICLLDRDGITDSRKGRILRGSRTLRDEIENTFTGHSDAGVRISGGRVAPRRWRGIRRWRKLAIRSRGGRLRGRRLLMSSWVRKTHSVHSDEYHGDTDTDYLCTYSPVVSW